MKFRKVPLQMLRFLKVPMQRLGQVPEGCDADTPVRIWKFPVQRLGEAPEGSGADHIDEVPEGSGAKAWFPKVPVQMLRSGPARFRCRG